MSTYMSDYAQISAYGYRPKLSINTLNIVNKHARSSPKSHLFFKFLKICDYLLTIVCLTQACMQKWINTDKIVRGHLVCGSL